MAKYALYDPTAAQPAPVIGWYDQDNVPMRKDSAGNEILPAGAAKLELTEAAWAGRKATPYVQGGALVGASAEQLLAKRQADAAAAYKRAAVAALAATEEVWGQVAEAVALGLTAWSAADVRAYATYRRALRAVSREAAPDVTKPLPAAPAVPEGVG
jgi:hypothetical protein